MKSCKKREKDKPGWNDWTSTQSVTIPNQPKAHILILLPGLSLSSVLMKVPSSVKGFAWDTKYKVQVLKAQPDCVLKAQAEDQRCHDKREFEHGKMTLENY